MTFLLSIKAGLRAKEITSLTWAIVTDAEGNIAEEITLTDGSSKRTGGGRTIPMRPAMWEALEALQATRGEKARPDLSVIYSERGKGMPSTPFAP